MDSKFSWFTHRISKQEHCGCNFSSPFTAQTALGSKIFQCKFAKNVFGQRMTCENCERLSWARIPGTCLRLVILKWQGWGVPLLDRGVNRLCEWWCWKPGVQSLVLALLIVIIVSWGEGRTSTSSSDWGWTCGEQIISYCYTDQCKLALLNEALSPTDPQL